jgi:hypothetical protein
MGVEAGITHGTVRGYRQHLYRHVPSCQPCRDANAEHQRGGKPAKPRPRPVDGRLTSNPREATPLTITRACHVDGCDTDAASTVLPDGWQCATVDGTRRRYCSPWCATYAEALADVRALREVGTR